MQQLQPRNSIQYGLERAARKQSAGIIWGTPCFDVMKNCTAQFYVGKFAALDVIVDRGGYRHLISTVPGALARGSMYPIFRYLYFG